MNIICSDWDFVFRPHEDGIECEVTPEFAVRFQKLLEEFESIQDEARKIYDDAERKLETQQK